MNQRFSIAGQYVAIEQRSIFPAELTIADGRILQIKKLDTAPDRYILPGFTDAHIHIESSMLLPAEFAKIAVTHGTVATVSDPHEIANVCGITGVDYMIENAKQVPLKFHFGAPSCVPATSFETAGAVINAVEVGQLLQRKEILYLTEMMNFPGVLHNDEEVMAKIAAAKLWNKPVDGHAPGLRGAAAKQYAAAGITTDHECVTLEEAIDKLEAGMYILIREGSAAKNYEALAPLFRSYPGRIMFCSDDKHPDELVKGHINTLVARAVADGYDVFDVLHAACVLPVLHYKLTNGLLQEGDAADLVVVDDLKDFGIREVYIDGILVAENGKSHVETQPFPLLNHFAATLRRPEDFAFFKSLPDDTMLQCNIIEALDGQLTTVAATTILKTKGGKLQTDVAKDILKIGVLNRYHDAPAAIGFVRNFGLKQGALASSVAHDSHNIVFVGVDDHSICEAVNAIIAHKGGISLYDGTQAEVMPLPVAGLMTDRDAATAAVQYEKLDAGAKRLGSRLSAPFMTLSFMALPVIPSLKMTDKGLFDVDKFEFINVLSGTKDTGQVED